MSPRPTPVNDPTAENQRTNVRSMFNSIAPTYDLINHLLSLGIDKSWRRAAIREMNTNAQSLVLDLATGTGDLALAALRDGTGRVMGVDPSFEMMQSGRSKFQSYPGQYTQAEGFGEFLPLQNNVFSHAMIAYGIRNVSNRAATFQELFRVLKSGGVLAVLEFSKPRNRFFAGLYNFYFHRVLPRIGGWISRNRDAYQYLPKTVEKFIEPEQLIREAEECGFQHKKTRPMFWGVTTLYVFQR